MSHPRIKLPKHTVSPGYRGVSSVVRPLLMTLTRQDWSGAEHLPPIGTGFIAAYNHNSPFDPVTSAHFLHDHGITPHFMAKASVFDIPVVGAILKQTEQIPVERGSGQAIGAYRAAVDAVRRGWGIIVYPEGTLTREPDLWPMRGKTGAARIALETGCPVIPVAQWGAHEIKRGYEKGIHVLPPKTIRVRAGGAVDLDDLRGEPVTRDLLADATERIMRAITVELEAIRGERAPAQRYDPRSVGGAGGAS